MNKATSTGIRSHCFITAPHPRRPVSGSTFIGHVFVPAAFNGLNELINERLVPTTPAADPSSNISYFDITTTALHLFSPTHPQSISFTVSFASHVELRIHHIFHTPTYISIISPAEYLKHSLD
jgi:hypothetical protein